MSTRATVRQLGVAHGAFEIETIPRIGYRLLAASAEQSAEAALPEGAPRTIAVLPFANLSPDPDQEYFADGLTEELISQLAQIQGLRVTGRSSSFAFKGRHEDLRVVGQKLGVTHILEGGVRRSGARLRITVQLVACADGYHLWSETFDRQLGEVFAIQEEVARAVTHALGVKLGVRPDYGGATSVEAFDHFLKAGRIWTQVDFGEIEGRIGHLRRAVAADPGYALAWANLSTLIAYRDALRPSRQPGVDAEREHATERAMALAPDLRAANVAAGWLLGDKRDWRAADDRIIFALRSGGGSDPSADTIGAGFLTVTGRIREGLRFRQAARDADPLSLGASTLLIRSYAMLGMWPEFDAEYSRAQDLAGIRAEAELLQLKRLLLTAADDLAVRSQFERTLAWKPPAVVREIAQAHGSRTEVRAVLARHLNDSPLSLSFVAQLAGAYRQTDLAIEALTRIGPDMGIALLQYCWCPELREARQDPRFKDVMRAVGLAAFWRESRKWPDFCRPLGEDDFEVVG